MIELEYHGPHDGVDVVDPKTGNLVGTVARGGILPVPDHVGESLIAQGPAHWRKPDKKQPPPKVTKESE